MAAAARHYGMFIGVQDLTCIGASFLHSAALAAHLPTVTFVEGNGRQYCPAGNEPWESIYRPMFRIRGGVVPTELLGGPGLDFDGLAEFFRRISLSSLKLLRILPHRDPIRKVSHRLVDMATLA